MYNIIDTYEIIGRIDDQKSISSNSLLNNEESNEVPINDEDKNRCNMHKSSELAKGPDNPKTKEVSKHQDKDDNKENGNNETHSSREAHPSNGRKTEGDVLHNAGGETEEVEKQGEAYKGKLEGGDGSKSKTLSWETVNASAEGEKVNTDKDAIVFHLSDKSLDAEGSKIVSADEFNKSAKSVDAISADAISADAISADAVSADAISGGTNGAGYCAGSGNREESSSGDRSGSGRSSCRKHYKVLIHAPACWKGEKFHGTPFIFVYDKSANFFTYSESPLEIEKYIIDPNADDFETRVLTIIFYDTLFACSTCSLLMKNNKGELQNMPKALSVFYLPLCKLDLENDSVKYRLALKMNSMLCDINIKEAISLFHNSSKLNGQNVNKFSLHFILKNDNYTENDSYNYLNQNTKIYGVPRSNLSTCIQKCKGNTDSVNNYLASRYLLNSSKSQVHSFKNLNIEKDKFSSLERIKNKWENYALANNEQMRNGFHNTLKHKNTKLTAYVGGTTKDNQSIVSKVKSEFTLEKKKNDVMNANKWKNNVEGFLEYTLDTSVKKNLYEEKKTKSYGDLLQGNTKLQNEFDVKDDILPEDSASMIHHACEKESAMSVREKGKSQENDNNFEEGVNSLTKNFRAVNSMYTCVREIMKKREDRRNDFIEEDGKQFGIKDYLGEDRSACNLQIQNFKHFSGNNSVCSSYVKNDDSLTLAIREIKQWMEKIEDKVSTISYEKSEINVNTVHNNRDKKYNSLLKFLVKNVKNNIRLKNKNIYKSCYLNIRNLYLVKKNDKIKFENKLLRRNNYKLKCIYKNVVVKLCKKIFLLKYFSTKDKFRYNKRYENMMRHLQSEKNDLLNIIENKKYEQENSLNINLLLSEELKKAQNENDILRKKEESYKNDTNKITTMYEEMHNNLNNVKDELEKTKIDLLNMKNINENIKEDKENLIRELGDTKAKYFNLTGILEGEEKMYTKKVDELEKKIQKISEEKNELIKDIKNEIDDLNKLIIEKENENIMIKKKLVELKNVEDKYKNTQINFDLLKKDFENSFDEVQIILKEMMKKEKEYIKKYNYSIKCLEEENKDIIIKLTEQREFSICESNYYKHLCKYQYNKMISFNDSLDTAEKLLDHVLSQYPLLLNELKMNSRNHFINKSCGKMHYENIQAVRDNIKLIRKSLNNFKTNSKGAVGTFNMHPYYDHSKKTCTQKGSKQKGNHTSYRGNSGMNGIFRYYEGGVKHAGQEEGEEGQDGHEEEREERGEREEREERDEREEWGEREERDEREEWGEREEEEEKGFSNLEFNHTTYTELGGKRSVSSSGGGRDYPDAWAVGGRIRNVSITSNSQKTNQQLKWNQELKRNQELKWNLDLKRSLDLKKKMDSCNAILHKNVIKETVGSGSIPAKNKLRSTRDRDASKQHIRRMMNGRGYAECKENSGNRCILPKERDSVEVGTVTGTFEMEKVDWQDRDSADHERVCGKKVLHEDIFDVTTHCRQSSDNKEKNRIEDAKPSSIPPQKEKCIYDKIEDLYDNISQDIKELNNIDIVNMYESSNQLSTLNTPEDSPAKVESELVDSVTQMKKDTDVKVERCEFDKNNFKDVISFIEKNVIKNAEYANEGKKTHEEKTVDESKNGLKRDLHKMEIAAYNSGFENKGGCKPDTDGKSPRRENNLFMNTGSSATSYQSSKVSKLMDREKSGEKRGKCPSDSGSVKNVSNNLKVFNKCNIAVEKKSISQWSFTKNASHTLAGGRPLLYASKRNPSAINRKANEHSISTNYDETAKKYYSTHHKCKNMEQLGHTNKDISENVKCEQVSSVKKSLISDRFKNKDVGVSKGSAVSKAVFSK
ncbi:hypothetical protein POVWA1_050930 [Plasmodium ovale wallikeri]|uniref:Uncharacterized protein n=1 Tax=Plasmodium ovale wallikeri TaxID=864142 RepID=A0A1A8ZLZ0_PLAOA|nr:hypothetical protein POVWA1_050930 [Plasmodium ovale wallikeri]